MQVGSEKFFAAVPPFKVPSRPSATPPSSQRIPAPALLTVVLFGVSKMFVPVSSPNCTSAFSATTIPSPPLP